MKLQLKEDQVNRAIAEYLEHISPGKVINIKENLKYDLNFRDEFRSAIYDLSCLIAVIANDSSVQDLMEHIMRKGPPKYQETKDMLNFYLNDETVISDLSEDFSVTHSTMKTQLEAIKEILEKPALFDKLQGLEKKNSYQKVKI